MNKVFLGGRLVKDPVIKYGQGKEGQITIASFTLAIGNGKDKPANYINCTAFGKIAEIAEKWLKKGMLIFTEGSWVTGSYKDKEGKTVYNNTCSITSIEFGESKKQEPPKPIEPASASATGFEPIPTGLEAELPFR